MRPKYKGKLIDHILWYEYDRETKKVFDRVTFQPTQVGYYYFVAENTETPPDPVLSYNPKKYCTFHLDPKEVVIERNKLSFYMSTEEDWKKYGSGHHDWHPWIVVELDEGELERLLTEDYWFQNQYWFKVTKKV